MPLRLLGLVEKQTEHDERHGADRQIDPEYERPADMLDEEGAEGRADDRSHTPDPRNVTLHPSALGRGVDVADDGRGNRLNGAGAGSLQPAEQQQRHHAPGQPAQGRPDEEQARSGKEDAFAAVEIGEPPVDRDRHRLGQQVCRKRPAEQVKPAELGDDRRHRSGDDRKVDRCHEDRHHHGGQHQPPCRLGYGRALLELF